MKKLNKKGFTIVELVIVIAVIAILAAVLIPTFSGIVTKAKDSAALQEASNAYREAYALALSDGEINAEDVDIEVNGFKFDFADDGSVTVEEVPSGFGYTVTVTDGVVEVEADD